MSNYVLVHGAWCWYKTLPLLEKAGHAVMAVDLSGLGRSEEGMLGPESLAWSSDLDGALGTGAPETLYLSAAGGPVAPRQHRL